MSSSAKKARAGIQAKTGMVIMALLSIALTAHAVTQMGACANKAYAESASSHSIETKVGKVIRYDEDGSRHDFSEDVLGVNGEMAFCMDPNVKFKAGAVSSCDILSTVSQSELNELALRAHYVQDVFQESYLSYNARVILAQTLIWEVLSPSQSFFVVPAEDGGSFPEVSAALRDEVYAKARSFAAENSARYEGFGTLWLNGETQPVATLGCRLAVGTLDLVKRSSAPGVTAGNDGYALEGAEYGIYSDANCMTEAGRLTTDSSGYAQSGELHAGDYYVREIVPPTGFALDEGIHCISVIAGQTSRVGGDAVYDSPFTRRTLATIAKHDAEIGWNQLDGAALGSATLANARYTVEHFSGIFDSDQAAKASGKPLRRWEFATNGDGHIDLSHPADFLISGELYKDEAGNPVFPIGTYVISESTPSDGYLLSDESFLVKVEQSEDGMAASGRHQGDAEPGVIAASEQVMRSDLAFTKVRESDMTRLAGIPFLLTSETTGESHVLVTDENGRVDTASSWNRHTSKTNANDAALGEDGSVDEGELDASAGSWFGLTPSGEMTEADDALGALPYDTYTLAELPCSANAGLVLVKMEGISITRDGTTLDLGTIDDKESPLPSIDTVAYDAADKDKLVSADASAIVRDEVELRNLVEGRTYALYGAVIDKETGLPALACPPTEDASDEDEGDDGAMPELEELRRFWDGLVELLGAKTVPTIDGVAYVMNPGQMADRESIDRYLFENEAIFSQMIVASQELTADAPRLMTTLDYEMDASNMEGDYVIYDLLVADDGAMAIHADTANEQESFAVEQAAQGSPGKGYYKTGSLLDALEGPTGASGMVAAGTAIGAGVFLGRRRLGGWMHA